MKLRVLESKNINILSLFSSSYKSSKLFTLPNRLQYDLIEKLGYTHCGSVAKLCLTLWGSMGCSMPVSLSFTVSQSLLKLMSVKSVMPANHLILCCPLLLLPSSFTSIRVFSNESLGDQSIEPSTSTSVLPINIQGWFALGLTGLISLFWKLVIFQKEHVTYATTWGFIIINVCF